jgi:hypothetical protein
MLKARNGSIVLSGHLTGTYDAAIHAGTWTTSSSPHDHQYKSFGRHAGVGVKHAKPIGTRLV